MCFIVFLQSFSFSLPTFLIHCRENSALGSPASSTVLAKKIMLCMRPSRNHFKPNSRQKQLLERRNLIYCALAYGGRKPWTIGKYRLKGS